MTDWAADVERLLFDGERVEETVDVGADRLVVTTHRVLAFVPSGPGSNFEAVHRPNVTAVAAQSGGASEHLERAVKAGVLGVFLLAGGSMVSLDGLLAGATVDPAAASQAGVGDLLGLLGVLATALDLVDDAMLLGGGLALLTAVAFAALYWRSRRTAVVVSVAGGEDVHLSGDAVSDATVTRLRRALGLQVAAD